MKRFIVLTSALALTLSTSGFAAEEASWGQIKNEQSSDFAAKKGRPKAGASYSTSASRTISGVIDAAGGRLTVRDMGPTNSPKDNLRAILEVPAGALDAPVEITMTLIGETLSELTVAFAPAGLVFLTPAELKVNVGNNLADLPVTQIRVDHVYADGTVESDVLTSVGNTGSTDSVYATVPGFSRYSMGGGGP